MMTEDDLVNAVAIIALVLGRDDLSAESAREKYTPYTLPTVLDGLLFDLEANVLENGRWEVPVMVNTEWLTKIMQVEIGSEFTVVTTSPGGAYGFRQYLTAK